MHFNLENKTVYVILSPKPPIGKWAKEIIFYKRNHFL